MLLFLYLTLAILTDMQTVTLATELFVGSESSANLAVPFSFLFAFFIIQFLVSKLWVLLKQLVHKRIEIVSQVT